MTRWRRCRHEHVRCVHGDEINHARGRRRACLRCGRYLKGPLPDPCTVSGRPHPGLALSGGGGGGASYAVSDALSVVRGAPLTALRDSKPLISLSTLTVDTSDTTPGWVGAWRLGPTLQHPRGRQWHRWRRETIPGALILDAVFGPVIDA